jgi:HPt (histidine-containing phosphotransfer) domain-containing protein
VTAPATAATSGDDEAVDYAQLARTFGNNQDKMRRYALLFVKSAGESLLEIDDALARGDLQRLAELGHRTKSSAKAVGAMTFAGLCQTLESYKLTGDVVGARQTVAQMQPLLRRIEQQFAQELRPAVTG